MPIRNLMFALVATVRGALKPPASHWSTASFFVAPSKAGADLARTTSFYGYGTAPRGPWDASQRFSTGGRKKRPRAKPRLEPGCSGVGVASSAHHGCGVHGSG